VAVSTAAEAFALVGSDAFSPRGLAVVETTEAERAHATRGGLQPLEVTNLDYGSGHMSAEVRAGPAGGFLVFGTSWAKGWSFTLDGHDAPLRIVDGAMMGAEISSGPHTVSFDFREPMLGAGALCSLLGAVLLMGTWVGRRGLDEHPLLS
jgi:hypothetical protein